jgi:hypothetical protein
MGTLRINPRKKEKEFHHRAHEGYEEENRRKEMGENIKYFFISV